ncbi:MAG: class I mannose-6-phosphate isomerase [Bacteroidales bacterium]|nr:class I mannose-6-phosphate isomerase [Bacteroidales bacterium]
MELYPLSFRPIIKDKIWGGHRLNTLLGKDFGLLSNGGESWEISGVEGDISVVTNGALAGKSLNEIITTFGAELMGHSVMDEYGCEFPLLIKFIDANDNLSVQVHPNNEMAQALHGCNGKTEMWYVMASDKGGNLISGFSKKIDSAQYNTLVNDGRFLDVLNTVPVKTGDVFFIPSGHIHGIGKGVMVAEIQQTSDITYRVFDYNRVDANGKGRELHIEKASRALDFNDIDTGKIGYQLTNDSCIKLIDCKYFNTGIIKISNAIQRDYTSIDSFVILMCVEGGVTINETYTLDFGQTLLIPACMNGVKITPQMESKLLEVYIP